MQRAGRREAGPAVGVRFGLGSWSRAADKGAPVEECPLPPSDPSLAFFCDAVARGAARGLSRVRGAEAPPWAVTAGRAARGSLATFPARAVPCSDDMMASVVTRVGPGPATTAVLAMEPEAALVLVRDRLGEAPCRAEDALAAVREVGAAVLRGVFEALVEAPVLGPAMLEEDALTTTLIRTHAPPEATLLSAELLLAGEHAHLRAVLLVLVDPKGIASLLDGPDPSPAPEAEPRPVGAPASARGV